MTGKNEKTQPQELLEEVIGITHGDRNEDEKFPTIAEQEEYWRNKEAGDNLAAEPLPFTCPTCLRKFKSPKAVAMHKARVHDMTILAPKQKRPDPTLIGGGLPQNPTGFREVTDKNRIFPKDTGRPVETLDTRRKKWSLARRRRYNARKKAREFGLPIGGEPLKWAPPLPPQEEEPVAMIRFCPHCGKGLERFLA